MLKCKGTHRLDCVEPGVLREDGAGEATVAKERCLSPILPIGAAKIRMDAMKPAEAIELLSVGMERLGVGKGQLAAARDDLKTLAARLGEWALLLALANGQLRNEIENGAGLQEAIRFVMHLYDEMGPTGFDPENESERTRAAALSIGASPYLKDAEGNRVFSEDDECRFEELALFPEDENIPAATIARLWRHTGGLKNIQAKGCCAN